MKRSRSGGYSLLFLALAGAVLGLLTSMLGQIPALSGSELAGIATSYGYWAVISGIICVHCARPWQAGLGSALFFAAMVILYFSFSWYVTGVLAWQTALWWLVLAAVSFGWGFAVWHHHRHGWLGAFCGSLPLVVTGLCAAQILLHQTGEIISLIVFILFWIYYFIFGPKGVEGRLKTLLFAVVLGLLWYFGVMSWLFGWLQTL